MYVIETSITPKIGTLGSHWYIRTKAKLRSTQVNTIILNKTYYNF